MKFSLIHPSRSRPDKSLETINKWTDMAYDRNQVDVHLSFDTDDQKFYEYNKNFKEFNYKHRHTNAVAAENKSAVDAINRAAERSKGEILIVVSDDSDCPEYWDKIILDAISGKQDFLLRVSDGIQKRICTLPIMDRAYYNRFGYIYNPIYTHAWCDTELTEVAYKLGRIIVRNDIEFRHMHPEVTKEPKDDLYKRNDLTHDRDRHIYENRKRINFGL